MTSEEMFVCNICVEKAVSINFFFLSAGTGEGEVADAEKLLKPFRLRYPHVGLSLSLTLPNL